MTGLHGFIYTICSQSVSCLPGTSHNQLGAPVPQNECELLSYAKHILSCFVALLGTLGVGIALSIWRLGYGLEDPQFEFSKSFLPAVGPTQPSVQWVLGQAAGA